MYFKRLFTLLSLSLLAVSCINDSASKEVSPNVSSVVLDDFKFVSAHSDIFKPDFLETSFSRDSSFYDLYFYRMLGFKKEANLGDQWEAFISADGINALNQIVLEEYPNTKEINNDFVKAFKYLKHYFPEYQTPNVYYFISEFGYQSIIFGDKKTSLGVGLDMYLGNAFDYKQVDPKNPAFSDYLTRSYNREHIVSKSISVIISDLWPDIPSSRTMLDHTLEKGKELYILKKLLPKAPDHVIFEHTEAQMDWLKNNEKQLWSFFLDEDLFYTTNAKKFTKYINDSPNSPGMPSEAPGKTASYIGYKIIRAYMARNPELSLDDLLSREDSQEILNQSRYKPNRK